MSPALFWRLWDTLGILSVFLEGEIWSKDGGTSLGSGRSCVSLGGNGVSSEYAVLAEVSDWLDIDMLDNVVGDNVNLKKLEQ